MKKLIIIDGNAILHRAFHAIPPLTSPDGVVVNAVYGFVSILIKILKDLKPDYIAATFDLSGPTFRHDEYAEYKAHRIKQPDELYAQIPLVKEVLTSLGIPIFEMQGYEADDLIGTLATKMKKQKDIQTIIATGDLDALQLVDGKKVVVFTMRKGIADTVIYDETAVKERYSLTPNQLIDYRGLKGDPSDNIPGVPGIGEKTAGMLILSFGNLDNMYKLLKKGSPKKLAADYGISEKLIQKLLDNKDKAYFSKKLSTIVTDMAVEPDLAKMEWRQNLDLSKVETTLKNLGFFSLVKRLPEIGLTRQTGLDLEIPQKPVTKQTSPPAGGFKPSEKNIYFAEGPDRSVGIGGQKLSSKLLKDPKCTIIGHDIKEALKPFIIQSAEVKCKLFDTKVAAYLLNPDASDYDFQKIYYAYFKEEADDPDQKPSYLWRLKEYLWDKLKSADLTKVFEEIEMPLINVLAEMEINGIKINKKALAKLLKTGNIEIAKLEKQIYKYAGTQFNINSPKQLGEILFNRLNLTAKIRRTGGGALSTAASELEKLRDAHPVIELVMQYRELQKLRSTYIEPFPELIAKDGRIHTTYNQTVAGTGRLSSQDPNLQNIPVKTALGQEFRRAFIADADCQLVSFDYSQIELRVVAHIAKDKKMIETFNRGEDIHTRTAVEIFKVAPDKVTKDMRRVAKVLNFGIIYGMGSTSFARASGVDRTTAKEFITKYFKEFQGVAKYMEETKQLAHTQGYVETIFGRRRNLPDIRSTMPMLQSGAERAAINHPIQGTAADLVKLAMLQIHDYLHKNEKSKDALMLLQIHDEIVVEIKKKEVAKFAKKIKQTMESVYKLDVPLIVDVKVGENWWDMEKSKI